MNERIEDFAIHCAGQMVWEIPKDPEEFTFNRDELTKFAELIIKECSDVVINSSADYHAVKRIAAQIRCHFGVE